MIVEKSFKRAKLTGQIGNEDWMLEVIPHPSIRGCCLLTIRSVNSAHHKAGIEAQITVNNSELKKVADMLCGIGDVNIDSNPYLGCR